MTAKSWKELISFRKGSILLMVLIWVLFVVLGFRSLYHEQFTPVATSTIPAVFPSKSAISLDPNKPTLILFAHPHCPCTEATFRQFNQLVASAPGKFSLNVVFALPPGVPPGWERGDLLQAATHLPNCRVIMDKDNVEADRFDVKGSGHLLVYSARGNLLFSGGITASRGHDGDNLGRLAVTSLALTGQSTIHQTPVFGCSLR